MDNDFEQEFKSFYGFFSDEKSIITSSLSINTKLANEMQVKGQNLIEKHRLLSQIYYLTEASRVFTLEELTFPLREFKTLSIASSLRIFQRPNHKDRFSHMIYFLVSNPTYLAQIVYFMMLKVETINVKNNSEENQFRFTKDDIEFFCYSTFPSMFLYFLTESNQESGVKFIISLYQLHFYLHLHAFGEAHKFLHNLAYSYFISTDPGKFFRNSLNPLIPMFYSYVDNRNLKYTKKGDKILRYSYWVQIAQFSQKFVQRMIKSVPLLPNSTRKLIGSILVTEESFEQFKYLLIVKTFICRYITSYIDNQDQTFLNDISTYLICASPLQHRFKNHISDIIKDYPIDFNILFDSFKVKKNVPNVLSDAIDISGRSTLITPRDLALIYKAVKFFQNFVDKDNQNILNGILTGISEPKEVNDDKSFMSLRVWVKDSALDNIQLKSTQPYDEIIDLLNMIDLSKTKCNSPKDVQNILFENCSIFLSPLSQQKITIEVLSNTNDGINNIIYNKDTLTNLSDKLSSALFVTKNEIKNYNEQLSYIINMITKLKIIPSLIDEYPYEFVYSHDDIFAPLESYTRLIETASKRIQSLNLLNENQIVLQKNFFMDFVDQIDIAFSFQSKVKTDRLPRILSTHCQKNGHLMYELNIYQQGIISKAAIELQFIKTTHKISYNLNIALLAMKMLSIFDDDIITLAIAMSGNVHLFGFIYFINSYLKDKRIINVLMNEEEQSMISRLRKSIQELHLEIISPN